MLVFRDTSIDLIYDGWAGLGITCDVLVSLRVCPHLDEHNHLGIFTSGPLDLTVYFMKQQQKNWTMQ